MQNQHLYTKYISIVYRLTNRFYDHQLSPYQVGCGKQFFLLRVHENEGISMYELAAMGRFDKGTVTKGIQKLEEQGYIRTEADSKDKRVRRLYTTTAAKEAVAAVYNSRMDWHSFLTEGMTQEEADLAEKLLQRMAENAYRHTVQNCRGCTECPSGDPSINTQSPAADPV